MESFHLLRVSDSFVTLWHRFLDLTSLEKNPLLFQYVSDQVFQELITTVMIKVDVGMSPCISLIPSHHYKGSIYSDGTRVCIAQSIVHNNRVLSNSAPVSGIPQYPPVEAY